MVFKRKLAREGRRGEPRRYGRDKQKTKKESWQRGEQKANKRKDCWYWLGNKTKERKEDYANHWLPGVLSLTANCFLALGWWISFSGREVNIMLEKSKGQFRRKTEKRTALDERDTGRINVVSLSMAFEASLNAVVFAGAAILD